MDKKDTQKKKIKTLDNLHSASDEELFDLYDESGVKKCRGEKFSQIMEVEFSYSSLRNEIERRGYADGWHKPNTSKIDKEHLQLNMKNRGDYIRQPLKMSRTTFDRWKNFAQNAIIKAILMDAALERFMDEVESGKLEISFNLNKEDKTC